MISVPEVKSISDIYIFDWVVEKIKVKLDRLHERADGVTGEILISHNDGHLYHGRLNLLSASSKTTLTNLLTKRVNSLDWQAVIEQVAMKSLQGFRTGEPLIDLKILPARTSPRYRLYPFILEGERQVFYGYGGQGKSKMAQIMATLVHCGVNMLDISVKQGNTLILDWESSAQTVREFINAFKFGMGIQSDNIPLY